MGSAAGKPLQRRMNNGLHIPAIGLGTFLATGDEGQRAVEEAVRCGYRHIDTAMMYANEADIGEAINKLIKKNVVKRNQLFITTKLGPAVMGADMVKPACEESLRKLKLDFIDLLLIHFPVGMKYMGMENIFPKDEDGKNLYYHHDHVACWKEMERLVDEGLVRSIGVSNFNSKQVDRILTNCRIKPVVNQIECHAYLPNTDLCEFLKERDIVVTAYAPFASPGIPDFLRKPSHAVPLFQNDLIVKLAKKYKKTPAQICLRNLVQRGLCVIPKSSKPGRIKENVQIFNFQLSTGDMNLIARLSNGQRMFYGPPWGEPGAPEFPFSEPF